VTGGAEAIARILRPHVARVVVTNTKKLRQISEANQKTDRLDARRLAELLAAGLLAEVWCPDEKTRALRRLVARRAQLVRQRTRAKNEIAAALLRHLLERPDVDDVAGTKAGCSFRSSRCRRMSAPRSRAACARSRSSMGRSQWSTARSPKRCRLPALAKADEVADFPRSASPVQLAPATGSVSASITPGLHHTARHVLLLFARSHTTRRLPQGHRR
jgi:hypothetical protein